jgi:RHS repeat-associated protein
MERNSQTYYYHRDGLGSVTEVSDSSGTIVERYEYDIYGAATIYDGNDVVLSVSAVGNPYLFTGRRFDPESGNYYYRARVYSPELGRFLSVDPLGFDAGDYNLYRYVFNNPINATDPTGELAFLLPFLLSASAEAAVDALLQATISYFFDPSVSTVSEAISSINPGQVAVAFITGFIPGGRWVKSGVAALGDVLINYLDALSNCQEYTAQQAIFDFAIGIGAELLGDKLGELIAEYGMKAIRSGFRRLGLSNDLDAAIRHLDDGVNDPPNVNVCRNSFSAETAVVTDEGEKPISSLVEGDMVLAYNEATGEIDYYPIIATISHEDPVVQLLKIDDETIVTTPNHPFKTGTGEWVPAGELQVGDTIRTSQWDIGTIEAITFVYDPQPMYNLTVATAHTYFVGDGEWLVHNCGDGKRLSIPERLKEYYRRLNEAPLATSADEAFDLISETLHQVEDDLSGIVRSNPPPPPNMSDGRMYPPLKDYTTRHPDGSITARTRGHTIEIDANGGFRIINRRTNSIDISKLGGG